MKRISKKILIYTTIRDQILNGKLHEGIKLPTVRDLAKKFDTSSVTLVKAFDLLEKDGY